MSDGQTESKRNPPPLPEDDLDRLVLEASSEFSLVPDHHPDETGQPIDPGEPEEFWRKRRFWRSAGIVTGIVIAAGALIWVFVAWAQSRQAEALVEETTNTVGDLISKADFSNAMRTLRDAQAEGLSRETGVELEQEIRQAFNDATTLQIESLIAEHQFDEARRVLETGREMGLRGELSTQLEQAITHATETFYHQILADADTAIRKKSVQAAKDLLAKAEIVLHHQQTEHAAHVRKALGALERELEVAPAKALMQESRDAAGSKDWDRAIALIEKARILPREGGELETWEQSLRDMVGGRLRVNGGPKGVAVSLPGHDDVKPGEVVFGLPVGTVEVTLQAEGHIPEIVHAGVFYPEITEVTIKMAEECPGPLWAINALAGRCAQDLALAVYLRTPKYAKWHKALKALAQPCQPQGAETASGLDEASEEFDAAVAAARAGFLGHEGTALQALDGLGEFIARHPRALEPVLEDKECISAVRQHLRHIETGCAHCAGQGHTACSACRGRGKRKEMRSCPTCDGTGQRVCKTCEGSGEIECRTCEGKGKVSKRVKDRKKDRWETRQVKCDHCDGSGRVDCARCRKGKKKCTKCKGTGERESMGPCSSCRGKGGITCKVCQGTKKRARMEILERRQIEGILCGDRP